MISMTTMQGNRDDSVYHAWLACIQARFLANTMDKDTALFTTDHGDLYSIFLSQLPPSEYKYHDCSACRAFMNTYGGLVTIDEDGQTSSAMWDILDAPPMYLPAIMLVEKIVESARVTGVFLTNKMVWGHPITGPWHHFAVVPNTKQVFSHKLLSASQAMAEKREDYRTLTSALSEYSLATLEQAAHILGSDMLYRSEKVQGVGMWLFHLQKKRLQRRMTSRTRENVVWRTVATEPSAYCHVKSTMIGTLLDDLAGGMDFARVAARFKEKMNPTQYQRPQAAPAAGNIAQAERIVVKLKVERAMYRRFARLIEVPFIWKPRHAEHRAIGSGVFGSVIPKQRQRQRAVVVSGMLRQEITWEKFRQKVMPKAISMQCYMQNRYLPLGALVTATYDDAPPILQWDREDLRNPASWYVYTNGSRPRDWNLTENTWVDVTAITLQPSMWTSEHPHHGQGVLFLLKGARDVRYASSGLGIFPEMLKSEFHGIRSTIEEYSNKGIISGYNMSDACGLALFESNKGWNITIKVTMQGMEVEYLLERWD